MNRSMYIKNRREQFLLVLGFIAMFISGCSSSDSNSSNSQALTENVANADTTTGGNGVSENDPTTSAALNGNGMSGDDLTTDATTNSETEGTADTTTGSINTTDTTDQSPALDLIQVTFDITVPVYVSNTLQVRLMWGDVDITADWVVDESWTVIDDFPPSTANPLTVTFSDRNGAVTLATYTAELATRTNPTLAVQINANQFDTEQWDTDNDGVSNLDESLAGTNPLGEDLPEPVQADLELRDDKTFRISWNTVSSAEFYRVLENPDGFSGYTQIASDLESSTRTLDHRVALFKRVNAQYIVQSCNEAGCVNSEELMASGTLLNGIVYIKASNTDQFQFFGNAVALSADGTTLAVGSITESSSGIGVNGNQNTGLASSAGAVYVFTRINERWQQSAYIKASNTSAGDLFGAAVSINANGDTIAVGAYLEDSDATGVNGNQFDNSRDGAGAVYVFSLNNGGWQQQAYLKADNANSTGQMLFGSGVSLSASGNTLAVSARSENNAGKGVNNPHPENTISRAGAAYVFQRSNDQWQQQAYLKASNTDWGDRFGYSINISADGNVLAVGTIAEQSAATGINGDDTDNSIAGGAGAVFIFEKSDEIWSQQSYIKPSNPGENDRFGWSVSLSNDGRTLAVGANGEASSTMGVNGNQDDDSAISAGAVYVFGYASEQWQQQAYLKASNTDQTDEFGFSVSLSANGNTLAVGALNEGSFQIGINGNQFDNSAQNSGAAYVFIRRSGEWLQESYIKASNTGGGAGIGNGDNFGIAISLSADGNSLAVGAQNEDGSARGINNNPSSNTSLRAGAVYLY